MPLSARHQLDVHERLVGDRCVVTPDGELDLFTATELTRVLRGCERTARALVLDLSKLRFVDSAGLAAVLAQHRRAQKDGTDFSVTNPSSDVRLLLETSGLARVLSVA